jgi:hypothetical protein
MADADPKLVEKRSVPLMLIYSDSMFPLADLGAAMETIAILFFGKGRLRGKRRIENFQATEGSQHLLMKFRPAEFRFNSSRGFRPVFLSFWRISPKRNSPENFEAFHAHHQAFMAFRCYDGGSTCDEADRTEHARASHA